jgi:hypothetical protein
MKRTEFRGNEERLAGMAKPRVFGFSISHKLGKISFDLQDYNPNPHVILKIFIGTLMVWCDLIVDTKQFGKL